MKLKIATALLLIGMIVSVALVVGSITGPMYLDSTPEDPCKRVEERFHKVRWPDGTQTVVINGQPQISQWQQRGPNNTIVGFDGNTYTVGQKFNLFGQWYMYVLLETRVFFIDGCEEQETTTTITTTTTTVPVTTTTVVETTSTTSTTVAVQGETTTSTTEVPDEPDREVDTPPVPTTTIKTESTLPATL